MNKEELVLSSCDEYKLSVAIFEAENAKANILVIHGMEEHKERYDDFASFLQAHGYNVITSDLRGHGNNAPILSHIADDKGEELIIQDQQEITKYIEKRFPNLPIMIFGHSMGTIISRVLLESDSKKYTKVALSGYVNPNGAAGFGAALSDLLAMFRKPTGHSKFITGLAVGQFAKAIENRKTDLDWLSYNEENVQNYINDSLCGVEFTLGSYSALFRLMSKMNDTKNYKDTNVDMPILLISGVDDPCTGGEKGRQASLENLKDAGFKDISVITLDNMRHEILNEKDKQKVYDDVLNFFDK